MLKNLYFLPIILVIQIFFHIFATNKKYNIMASKNVLSEAINKLVSANAILLEKGMKDKALEYYYLYSGLETDEGILSVVEQKIKKLEAN